MKRTILTIIVAALLAVACGDTNSVSGDIATSVVTTAAPPTTTSAPTTTTEAPEEALAIVSLSSTATEMLFAIGAGDLVVAVDEFSNYPPEAPISGLSGFTPSIEAIATFQPMLVVAQFDPGDMVAGLELLGIETLTLPAAASLEDVYGQIAELGIVTDRSDEAAKVVESMRNRIGALVSELTQREIPLTYFHEVGTEYFSATSNTFVGEIYALAGLENIADAADPDGSQFGFPLLTEEFIIDADPDIIFLADTIGYGQSAQTVGERPGWEALSAVQSGRIVELNDDLASRWGPRVVDLAETIFAAVADYDTVAQ